MQRRRLLTGIRLWGVRRVQVATVVRAVVGAALLAVLFLWHWFAGAVTVVAAGIAYVVSRLLDPSPLPYRPGGRGWFFGGELLAFAELGVIDLPRQRQVIDKLADEYRNGEEVELLVWVTTTDQTGQLWTLVQDQFGFATPTVTASTVKQVPGACDPYIEAENLVVAEFGVPLVDVTVVGWGLDWSRDVAVDVILVVGHTQAPAGSFAPTADNRSWQLVELHPDAVARALTRFDPARWRASAVWGLASCLELAHAGGRALLEELVPEPWRSRGMFSRLAQLASVRAEQPPSLVVDPVVMSVDHGAISERRQTRPRPARALAWERPDQRIPTRYG